MIQEIKRLKRQILINNLIIIFFFGVIMNISVIAFNNGKMPVLFGVMEDSSWVNNKSYIPFNNSSEVQYSFLSDIIHIGRIRFSIGDILTAGSMIAIICVFTIQIYKTRKCRSTSPLDKEKKWH